MGTFKAVVKHSLGLGQDCVLDLHYVEVIPQVLTPPAELLANELEGLFNDAAYLDLIMDSTILDRIEVTEIGGDLSYFNLTVGVTGNMTGQQLPPQNCPLVSFYTAKTGRDQHGRIYLPPPNVSQVVAGSMGNAFQADVQSFADTLLTLNDGLIDRFQLVVYHAGSNTTDDVIAAVVREDFATQRRRVPGIGS